MWIVALTLLACRGEETDGLRDLPEPDPTCDGIYGAPNENTGLGDDVCVPEVAGEHGAWAPPDWDAAALAALGAWTLLDPPEVPVDDPYAEEPSPRGDDASVCVVVPAGASEYRLETYSSADAAEGSEGAITHGGACGLCSSLADLAVYAGIPDLTQPVRACGLEGVLGGFDATESCLLELGFTPPCARIWAYNTQHTQEACFDLCITALDDPYNEPDGSLNACLQCDEDESGQVFKALAGRTRRNSGLATALCRPCETVWRIEHGYAAL